MKNSKILAKIKSLWLPFLLFAFVFLTSVLFLKPKIREVIAIQQKISQERKTLAQLTQKVALLEGLDQNELSTKTDKVLKILPTEKNVPFILQTLRLLSSQTNINLSKLTVSPGSLSTDSAQLNPPADLPVLTLDINLDGDKDKIKSFLSSLEFTSPLMRVKTISFSQKGDSSIALEMVLETYFLPLPQTLGKPEQPVPNITSQEQSAYQLLTQFKSPLTASELPVGPAGKENPFVF